MTERLHIRPGTDEHVTDAQGREYLVRWAIISPMHIMVSAQVMGEPFMNIGPTSYGIPIYNVHPELPVRLPLKVNIGDATIELHGPIALKK